MSDSHAPTGWPTFNTPTVIIRISAPVEPDLTRDQLVQHYLSASR